MYINSDMNLISANTRKKRGCDCMPSLDWSSGDACCHYVKNSQSLLYFILRFPLLYIDCGCQLQVFFLYQFDSISVVWVQHVLSQARVKLKAAGSLYVVKTMIVGSLRDTSFWSAFTSRCVQKNIYCLMAICVLFPFNNAATCIVVKSVLRTFSVEVLIIITGTSFKYYC